MKTITEHLDDLDRMIDAGNTPKSELRYQVAFIGKLVSALEQDYTSAIENQMKLYKEQSQRHDKTWRQLEKESEEYHRMIQSKQLKAL